MPIKVLKMMVPRLNIALSGAVMFVKRSLDQLLFLMTIMSHRHGDASQVWQEKKRYIVVQHAEGIKNILVARRTHFYQIGCVSVV